MGTNQSEETIGVKIYKSLLKNSNQHDAMFDVNTNKRLSSKQLLQASCNLAQVFRKLGYPRDTVISVYTENNVEFFIPVIASLFAGITVSLLNPMLTEMELAKYLKSIQPRGIFCSRASLTKALGVRKTLPAVEDIVVIDSTDEKLEAVVTLEEFVRKNIEGPVNVDEFRVFNENAENHTALIISSSGTTGLPKGVMLSHRSVTHAIEICSDSQYGMLSESSTTIVYLPFFHVAGLIASLTGIACNRTLAVMKRFDADLFLEVIQNYKITGALVVPTVAATLAKNINLEKYDLSCLKYLHCGAAPLSITLETILKEKLSLSLLGNCYGLTETTFTIALVPKNLTVPGTCGKAVSKMSIKIFDPETNRALGRNELGEIRVKGIMLMSGYYNNPEATKEAFDSDGWLKTGDLGYFDENDCLVVVDRIKEVMKYKGYQIAPAELEEVLLEHPDVTEVAVVGLPDEASGELPLAFVVKKAASEVTAEELQKYVADRVAPIKKLRGGVAFVSSIPKNPTGKILRRELRLKLKQLNNINSLM